MISLARCLAVLLVAFAIGAGSTVTTALPLPASLAVDVATDVPDSSLLGAAGTRSGSAFERRHGSSRWELPLAASVTDVSAYALSAHQNRFVTPDSPRRKPALHSYDATAPPRTLLT